MMQAMFFVFGNIVKKRLDDDQLTYLGLPALTPHYMSKVII